ncbi:MarR family winged helix-turn-helix transcriptional regulator [Nocardia sp. NPDC051321]|uniref:MarR family winged helix-turn-helix transcriptional regulator n=1 Tax=Nocardia sp. NPDC051321 TaxID=3364323 RepID=UPI00379375CB
MNAGQIRNPRRGKLAKQVDAVLRTSRALVGIAAASIAEVDTIVSVPQLRVLVMVHTHGTLNLATVAAGLEVNPSNASRTCDRLIAARLLQRHESATDRRHVELTLTPAGEELVDRVTTHRRLAIERILKKLSSAERDQVAAALDLFAATAGEPDERRALTMIWPRN